MRNCFIITKGIPCIFFMTLFIQCHKNDGIITGPQNIRLINQPLEVVQKYTIGKWRLIYSYGGIIPLRKEARNNQYLSLNINRIIIGNDSSGVVVDTTLAWKQVPLGNEIGTYFSYYFLPSYAFAINKLIQEIKNDTLIIRDYSSDPLYTYYTKF